MPAEELQGLLDRARSLEPQADYDAALRDLDAVVAAARAEGLTSFEAAALQHKARLLRIKSELGEAEQSARAAADLYTAAGDQAGTTLALLVLGEIFSDQAKLDEFEQLCRQALDLSRAANSATTEARALTLLGSAHALRGRSDEAGEPLRQAAAIYQRLGDRRGGAAALMMLGRVDHMQGQLALAARSTEQALGLFEELGDRRGSIAAAFSLGQMEFERGELTRAQDFAQRGLAAASASQDIAMHLRCQLLLSQIQVEVAPNLAVDAAQAAEDLCTTHGLISILPELYRTRAQAYLGLNRLQDAEQYARLGREAAAGEDTYSQGTTLTVQALVYQRQGLTAQANDGFVQAMRYLEDADETFELGWGHLCYGEYLLSQGATAAAQDHLRAARDAFTLLEAQSRLQQVNALLG